MIDFDALRDRICREGKTVFSLGWDGDFPGGSGAAYVTEWKGLYFVSSSDFDDEGPFSSLEDALALEYFSGPTANPELSSSVLSKAKLKKIAHSLVTEEGDEVTINHERFVLRNGKLRKPMKPPRSKPSQATCLGCDKRFSARPENRCPKCGGTKFFVYEGTAKADDPIYREGWHVHLGK